MLAYEATRVSDWVREDLPDLLWPAVVASKLGDLAAVRFREAQELVIQLLDESVIAGGEVIFDGRLTSIEAIPDVIRPTLIERFAEPSTAEYLLLREVGTVLSLYDDVPGAWLLVEPFDDPDSSVDLDEVTQTLVRAFTDVIRDDHLNALVKCPTLSWRILQGHLKLPAHIIDVLQDYPTDAGMQPMADGLIRSTFGAMRGVTEIEGADSADKSQTWASSFWNQNWHMFLCLPEEHYPSELAPAAEVEATVSADPLRVEETQGFLDGEARAEGQAMTQNPGVADPLEGAEDESDGDDINEEAVLPLDSGGPIKATIDLFNSFVEAALDHEKDVDLYSPAKHEVVCGFVTRAARSVLATLRAPHLWSGEHGMSVMRVLSESWITLAWMSLQNRSVYDRFQNYGRGKVKLLKKHMDVLADMFDGDPPESLAKASGRIAKELGGEWGQELQDVNLEPTFSGLSMRQMAIEADLSDEYRYVYQSASGVAHGEWWAMEEYAMQRCMNPLHLIHRIPSFEPEFPSTPEFGELLVRRLSDLIDLALSILFLQPEEELPAEGQELHD